MANNTPEDEQLAYTRDMRRLIVDKMTGAGKNIPGDTRELNVVLAALDGIDRQSIAIKKINSDEGIANQQAAAAASIIALYNTPGAKKLGRASAPEERAEVIPVLDESVVPPVIKEGELELTPVPETYESFTNRLGMNQVWDPRLAPAKDNE